MRAGDQGIERIRVLNPELVAEGYALFPNPHNGVHLHVGYFPERLQGMGRADKPAHVYAACGHYRQWFAVRQECTLYTRWHVEAPPGVPVCGGCLRRRHWASREARAGDGKPDMTLSPLVMAYREKIPDDHRGRWFVMNRFAVCWKCGQQPWDHAAGFTPDTPASVGSGA